MGRIRGTSWVLTLLLAAILSGRCPGDDLIPAGSINGVLGHDRMAFIVEDHPDVLRHATAIRDRFFASARILQGDAALEADLAGHNLIVYGTPGGLAWLDRHADRLPARIDGRTARVQDRTFRGRNLRVICAVRNPHDLDRRAVIYMASRPADLVEINAVFHGPTEWVVADGRRPLASGNYVVTAPLTRTEMAADLDFLERKIADVHPAAVDGLPDGVAAALRAARTRLDEPVDRAGFWLVLNGVLLALHDAHSSLHALKSGEMLDLPVRWLEDGLVVTASVGELQKGDRVVAIGEHDERQLLEAMRGLIPAENDGWIRHRAAAVLRDTVVLRMLGIAGEGAVTVTIERDGRTLRVEPGTGSPIPSDRPRRPWVSYTIEAEHGLAVLTLDRCTNDEQYRTTVRSFFEAVAEQRIPRIAVDLRENGGGNSSVTNEFLRYLDVPDFADYSAEVRVSEDVIARRGLGGKPRYDRHRPHRRDNDRVDGPAPFAGDVYLLTSNRSFSSGSWFATVLRDNDLATVVGEATGNSPSAYGDILTFSLPSSGYGFTLSFKKFVRPLPDRDPATHLAPDRHVPLTRRHLVDGVDPVLDLLRSGAIR